MRSALFSISSRLDAKVVVAGVLCVLMVDQPLLAMGEPAKKVVPAAVVEMQGQARVLHALNRLTFGPRPGDLAAVQAMGLNKWFEMQLNPGSIDDSKAEMRLAEYPAMQMPLEQLEARYPSPQMLKQYEEGRVRLPDDPAQRAMVQDQMAFYKKAQKVQQAQAAAAKAANSGDGMMAAAPATADTGGMAAGMDGVGAQGAATDGPMVTAKKKQAQIQAGFKTLMSDDSDAMASKPLAAAEVSAATPNDANVPDANGRALAMKMAQLPVDQRMTAILALSPQELVSMRQALQGPQLGMLTAGMTPAQKEMLTALPGGVRMIALESQESRLVRDIYSDRQLEAVMTDFWLNHFNVYVRKNQNEPYLIPTFERETIRPNALGKFEDLLVATAKSPAMLVYLDNARSVGPDSMQAQRLAQAKQRFPNAPLVKQAAAGLNENYGRELMELHTLGVNGGYTQADVTNVAKVFTGWGLDRPFEGSAFQFEERRHEPGSKTVLGTTIPESGELEGMQVLHILANSPATARFISTKLAVRFVSDTPPPALVDQMAASFLASDGDIKTVLRTMFHAPEFWATDVYRAKVKTPEEFLISAVRASGAQVNNPQALVQALDRLGMPLYGMQTPNGYSWTQEGWVSTGALVSRMNFSLVLSGDKLPGTRTSWSALLGEKAAGVEPAGFTVAGASDPALAKEKKLEMLLLGQPVSERTRQTVLAQSTDQTVTEQAATQFDLNGGGKGDYAARGLRRMQAFGPPDDAQAAVMAGLLLGSPEFQRR
jgi:uncharacterized protein (DUF1800 family)